MPKDTKATKEKVACSEVGCSKSFGRKADQQRHLKEHHGPMITCQVYGCSWKGAKREDRYHKHLEKFHGATPDLSLDVPEGFSEYAASSQPRQIAPHNSASYSFPQPPYTQESYDNNGFMNTQYFITPPEFSPPSSTASNNSHPSPPDYQQSPGAQDYETIDGLAQQPNSGMKNGTKGAQSDFPMLDNTNSLYNGGGYYYNVSQ